MSPREKKLLIFFGIAGFLIINILMWKFYVSKRTEATRQLSVARQKLETARIFRASREQVTDQLDWLAKHEPEPAANQDVQTKLQQLCETEAKATNLTILTQKPLPTDAEASRHYHHAKIKLSVTGTEQALYQWFDRLNLPEQLRIASFIQVSPNKKDDTQIDCTATIEQWFVPLPPSAN